MIASLDSVVSVLRSHSYFDYANEMERLAKELISPDKQVVQHAARIIRGKCHAKDLGDLTMTNISYREWDSLLVQLSSDMETFL